MSRTRYTQRSPATAALVAALVAARRKQQLTQRDVAARMGISQSAISDLESGAHPEPGFALLDHYATACGHELRWELVPPARQGRA